MSRLAAADLAWGVPSYKRLAALATALLLGLACAFFPLQWLVPGLVVAAVGVAVLWRPVAGIALMLIAAPWGALESATFNLGPVDSGQILFIVAVGAWFIHAVIRRQVVLYASPISWALVLFIGFTALTLLTAEDLGFGLRELLKWVEIAFLVIVVTDIGTEPRERSTPGPRTFATLLLIAGISQALVGIWQFGLRGEGPDHFQILDERFYRAFGTFQQPNPYGGFMSWMALLGLGILAGALVVWWQRGSRSSALERADIAWLLFVGAATLVCAVALVMSWSRGAWLAFASGALVLVLMTPRQYKFGFILVFLSAAAFLALWQFDLIPTALSDRIGGFATDLSLGDVRGSDIDDSNYAVLERLAHWQAAVDMARENLWLGVGFGNYEPAYDSFQLMNWPFPLGHAHNYYLNLMAETGVIGTLLYLVLWAVILKQTFAVVRSGVWPDRAIAIGLGACWTALAVHHLLDKLYVNNLYLTLGVMLGLLQIMVARKDRA